ncbi:MAG: SDR family NAD(P)-dependent oxidoreductase [Rhodobacteraceae bacterium]|nr:SDR family NAD(P)-dependent oxidoreductase [Paracoccaceae bacterium]
MQISGKAAVVTGGASGLGEATARALAAAGAKVAIFDRSADRGEAVAAELGSGALFCAVDVADEASVTAALDRVEAAFGTVRAVVNCAGIVLASKTLGRDGPHPLDSYARILDVNLKGTFNVLRLAAARMAATDPVEGGERGVFVNTASVAAFDGQKGQAAYAASKGGIAASSLPIARDLARDAIRVNAIAPGLFLTPMAAELGEEVCAQLAKDVVFPKRLGDPAEFADAVLFLIRNTYVNGTTLRLDGAVRLP